MNIGLDIGYSSVKCKHKRGMFRALSVIGSEDRSRFGAGKTEENCITTRYGRFMIGDSAVVQSRAVMRREDRNWIESEVYYNLFVYAIARAIRACESKDTDINLVTGLPVAYFAVDNSKVISVMMGENGGGVHEYTLGDDKPSSFTVKSVRVIPQPFGTVFFFALDDEGLLVPSLSTGRTGVIDIGGKTTNILSVVDLSELTREATSINIGGWDMTRALSDILVEEFPALEMRDQELEQVIVSGEVTYFGKKHDVSETVARIAKGIAAQISGEITQVWGNVASFDRIFIAGGGANLVGSALTRELPQALVIKNPVLANSIGYYKYCMFMQGIDNG